MIDLVYPTAQLLESLTQPGFDCTILRCQPKEDSYINVKLNIYLQCYPHIFSIGDLVSSQLYTNHITDHNTHANTGKTCLKYLSSTTASHK